jgi:hypothetical protein
MFLTGLTPCTPFGGNGSGECEAKPLMEEIGTCAPQMREMVLKSLSAFQAKNLLRGGAGICPLKMGEMVLRGWNLSVFRAKNGVERGGDLSPQNGRMVLKSGKLCAF